MEKESVEWLRASDRGIHSAPMPWVFWPAALRARAGQHRLLPLWKVGLRWWFKKKKKKKKEEEEEVEKEKRGKKKKETGALNRETFQRWPKGASRGSGPRTVR